MVLILNQLKGFLFSTLHTEEAIKSRIKRADVAFCHLKSLEAVERFTMCNSAYSTQWWWYLGGNELSCTVKLWPFGLLILYVVVLWPCTQSGCFVLPPPCSTAAKWTRIDLSLSQAPTRQKSSTSTLRKAGSPGTRMLMWLYGIPIWQGEDPTSAIQQSGRKLFK